MSPEQYILLYEKFISGSCTPEEEALLMLYQDNLNLQDDGQPLKLSDRDKATRRDIYSHISQSIENRKARLISPTFWRVAASVLLVVMAGSYFILHQPVKPLAYNKVDIKKDVPIKPGTNTAILTLANGSQIILDKARDGVLTSSGNTTVMKMKNGLLAYVSNGKVETVDPDAQNTIVIPRGGQYMVTLSDSTKVWLNSKSSLTYPVVFTGAERAVTLKGEAYFEVAKNKKLPFIVHTPRMDVKVLGTHFNVDAYDDETDTKTTLLEGSVSLSKENNSALLVPGEQGIAGSAGNTIRTRKVNTDHVIAWKQGYFIFREENIREIMKQISRWYDVDIDYQGAITNEPFGGTYSKSKNINELLKGLELTELVHFKIEGRRIIVMN